MTMTLPERRAAVANMRSRGLTQQQVADMLDVAQSVVSRDEAAHADRTGPQEPLTAPHGGACLDADPDAFFPDTQGACADDALRICLIACDVLTECAAFGVACDTFHGDSTGVIGGTTPADRHEVRMGRATVDELHAANRSRLGIGDAA